MSVAMRHCINVVVVDVSAVVVAASTTTTTTNNNNNNSNSNVTHAASNPDYLFNHKCTHYTKLCKIPLQPPN